MMVEKFYSNYATTTVSCWPKAISELIHQFTLSVVNSTSKESHIFNRLVSAIEINQADDDSHQLVKEGLRSYVLWQKMINLVMAKQHQLDFDLTLSSTRLKSVVDAAKQQPKDLTLLEDVHTALRAQRYDLEQYNQKTETWRQQNLHALFTKWSEIWINHRAKYNDGFFKDLKNEANIELAEHEKSELIEPKRSRAELLRDIRKYYQEKLPKGYSLTGDLFRLRILWALTSYILRGMASANEGSGTMDSGLKVADLIALAEAKEVKKLLQQQDQDFSSVRASLNKLYDTLKQQKIGLSIEEKYELSATEAETEVAAAKMAPQEEAVIPE